MIRWSENNHVVKGIDPVADAFSGTVYSDIVSMRRHGQAVWLYIKGVGTTGTATITVEASDNFAGSNVTAIPFHYRRCCNTADTQGALTAATAAGFTTIAGSSEVYVVEVLPEDMGNTGYGNVRLKSVEVANDPIVGCILTIMADPTFAQAIQPTAIS